MAQATHGASESPDGTAGSFRTLDPPREPPFFQFFDASGQTLTLANFRGKVLLLNLWATWCVPCICEMPALDPLQAKIGKEDFVTRSITNPNLGIPGLARDQSDPSSELHPILCPTLGLRSRADQSAQDMCPCLQGLLARSGVTL